VQNALAVLDESPAIEFKETFGNEKELKEGVLRSIVAFLNSKDGYGLLVLGVRDERSEKRITGISTKLVKGRNPAEVEGHLRNIVSMG
jgi:predicted HTH transcriptional regulator